MKPSLGKKNNQRFKFAENLIHTSALSKLFGSK